MRKRVVIGGIFSLLTAISIAAADKPSPRNVDLSLGVNPANDDLYAAATPDPSGSGLYRQPQTLAKAIFPGYTIRRTVPEVRLQFSVTDESGRLLTNLSPGDFRIYDNQSAVQRLRQFSRLNDLPLQIGILLDISDSVQGSVWNEKLAMRSFVQQVFRPQTDRASLMAFSRELRLWQSSTGDASALQRILDQVQPEGHVTNLYDGLFAACARQFPGTEGPDAVQRIIVLFSDGEDTGSLHGMPDVISIAQRKEIQIFALSIHAKRKSTSGDEALRRLTDETGGQFYVATSSKEFSSIFAAMEQQMRTQYSVSFQPLSGIAGFHSLRLELTSPQKLRAHARQGYYLDAP
jgi:Ca-activated chloride channel family protein